MKKIKSISRRYVRPRWNFISQDKKGILHIDGISVNDLTGKYGTPVYVLVEKEIRGRLRNFKQSFPYVKLRPQYAGKCNSNLEILKIVREEGWELDASSVGEIILGLLADFKPNQITFTNLYKTEQDIHFAAQVGVQAITVDSFEELQRVNVVGEKLRKKIRIFLRINPIITLGNYTSKHQQYGVPNGFAKKAIDFVKTCKYIDLIGLHFHGSYIDNPKIYYIAAARLLKLAKYCQDNKIKIKFIDLGGGFPVAYGNKEVFDPAAMGRKFVNHFYKLLNKYLLSVPYLIFEPGKYIVANAGIGLTKIISKKQLSKNKTLIVDGSTYAFVPDVIIYHCYYDILPATKMTKPRRKNYRIAGCTCDSIDIIANNRWLPKLDSGDILAIMDCGAYSNTMASNFNNLKRAPMIMIKENGTVKLIRRRDRYSEMFGPELDVLKIADPSELKKFYNLFRVNIDKYWRGSNNNGNKK